MSTRAARDPGEPLVSLSNPGTPAPTAGAGTRTASVVGGQHGSSVQGRERGQGQEQEQEKQEQQEQGQDQGQEKKKEHKQEEEQDQHQAQDQSQGMEIDNDQVTTQQTLDKLLESITYLSQQMISMKKKVIQLEKHNESAGQTDTESHHTDSDIESHRSRTQSIQEFNLDVATPRRNREHKTPQKQTVTHNHEFEHKASNRATLFTDSDRLMGILEALTETRTVSKTRNRDMEEKYLSELCKHPLLVDRTEGKEIQWLLHLSMLREQRDWDDARYCRYLPRLWNPEAKTSVTRFFLNLDKSTSTSPIKLDRAFIEEFADGGISKLLDTATYAAQPDEVTCRDFLDDVIFVCNNEFNKS